MSAIMALTSTGLASSGWRREKASSRCVRAAARSVPVNALPTDRCHLRFVGRKRPLQQRQIAMDDLQQIVEVVRNPARQLPDGLHLLRVAKHFLRLGPPRNLLGDAAFERLVERAEGLLRFHALLDLMLGGPVELRLVDRDRRLRGDALHQALVALLEAAGLGMTEEEAADHFSGAADDGNRKVADDGEMALRHAVVRRVLAVAGVLCDVVGADHAFAPEGRPEHVRVPRHREFVEVGAVNA